MVVSASAPQQHIAAIAAIATLPVFMPCSLRWNEGPRIGSGHGKSNEVKHIHHGGTPYVVVLQASRHKGASFAQHGGTRKRMALASRGPSGREVHVEFDRVRRHAEALHLLVLELD